MKAKQWLMSHFTCLRAGRTDLQKKGWYQYRIPEKVKT
jgi:hypothetical protein